MVITMIPCFGNNCREMETLEQRAKKIHQEVITIDSHIDINVKNFTDRVNYARMLNTQVDIPKMKAGGLDVAWFVVFTAQDSLNAKGYAEASRNALAKFEAIHRLCSNYAPRDIELALNSDDVRRIRGTGKKAAMIGVENAYPIGNDLSFFEEYHKKGARYISLSHNGHNQFCDSHTGEVDGYWLQNGLSELGKNAVKEMNRIGIMIDASHLSKESVMQIMALSKAPIIASHSSARALCGHSRNLDDEQLMDIKENRGVVQAVAFSAYLNTKKHEVQVAYMERLHQTVSDELGTDWYDKSQLPSLTKEQQEVFLDYYPKIIEQSRAIAANDPNAPKAVNIADFVDHIDYLVNRIGIDHVGISSDFDGGGGIEGWSDASETFNVTLELVRRNYSQEQIAKLWGENLLRVLDEVQSIAAELN